MIYTKITDNVIIRVGIEFDLKNADASKNIYIWRYNITIDNKRTNPIQVLRRQWHIAGEDGVNYQVDGIGIIGKQPIINFDNNFQYDSHVKLHCPSGIMYGHLEAICLLSKADILIQIPAFSLDYHDQLTNTKSVMLLN